MPDYAKTCYYAENYADLRRLSQTQSVLDVYTRITDMRDMLSVTSTIINNTVFLAETRRFETIW